MLSRQAGLETGFSVSVGKSCKYLDRYLPAETWKRLLSTYRNDTAENLWQSLLECQALFRESSRAVADRLGYVYPEYDEKVSQYIESLQPLPYIQSEWQSI
jgi:aminoglycoside 6-adenylyltransferase